jgi:hypothetical protein
LGVFPDGPTGETIREFIAELEQQIRNLMSKMPNPRAGGARQSQIVTQLTRQMNSFSFRCVSPE